MAFGVGRLGGKVKKECQGLLEEVYKKVKQIEKILIDEFPEVPKDRIELIANRIYDQIMYYDEDV